MPNPSKGARLYLRPARGGRRAVWLIRDGDRVESTGCTAGEHGEAQRRLADYITAKHKPSREDQRHPSEIAIADVLAIYRENRLTAVARPIELEQRIKALALFFGSKPLSAINGTLCRSYARARGSASLARRELEDLRAAINHHRREGLCSEVIEVVLPEKSQPRERWLTRDEAARLLWAAWRGGQGKRKHVARFILVGLYTGTRATAICQAAMQPTVGRGYVDLVQGVFYRRAPGTKETKKRQPPIRLHPKLLDHLRRWHRAGKSRSAIVEWKGVPIVRMAKGFREAARDAGLDDVSPHILRHTAITWAMQGGADRWDAAGQFGLTMEMLERVYGHHHPDHGASVHAAISRKRA